MIESFYTLFGQFDNTYFNMVVFGLCVFVVLFLITSFLNILLSFFKK